MAFNLLFLDSFDHYATAQLGQKWSRVDPSVFIDNTPGNARTGTNCVALVQDAISGGMVTNNQIFGRNSNLIIGVAFFPGIFPTGTIMNFLDQAGNDYQCFLSLGTDGSLSVINHYIGQEGPVLLTTPPGVIIADAWNFIEIGIIFSNAGSVYVRVNTGTTYSATGVDTIHSGNNWCDGVQLSGPAADVDSRSLFDDFYSGFSDNPSNMPGDFQGARRIYPYIPAANETPLQWTPLANTNWQETSQIPPPGDSAYVSSSAIGTTDQYQLVPISGEGPSGAWQAFGQVVISARLETAGGATIAPDIAGNVNTGAPLTTTYNMSLWPYLVNPATGQPFSNNDFATIFFGPQQTS